MPTVRVLVIWFALLLAGPVHAEAGSAGAVKIERVVSPGGIEAWLVEESAVPVVAVEIAIRGGARLDPKSKGGLANLMASLLDEGAGALSDEDFKAALEEKAIRLSFQAGPDAVYGSLRTLAPYTEDAFALMALALASPRFEPVAVERVRNQIIVQLAREASSPGAIARKAWYKEALGHHPYATPAQGSSESLGTVTRRDLTAFHKEAITRDRLVIAVVGPIDAERLGALLDKSFAGLPKGQPIAPVPAMTIRAESEIILIDRLIPQTVVYFGAPGLTNKDPDFMSATVMNYILGGGGFSSRLMDELREKRGLTYGISTGLSVLDGGGLFIGSFSTANEAFPEAFALLKSEIARLAAEGVSDSELADAKTYLTGSFALRFDANDKIAGQLLGYQLLGYPIDYINTRNDLVRAVTKDDVARAAERLLDPSKFLFVAVGQPAAPASGQAR